MTSDSIGKGATMHLTEFKSAKYFGKDILPYCIIQPPLKKISVSRKQQRKQ